MQRGVTCIRAKPQLVKQIMDDQPVDRVEPPKSFVNGGIDFCSAI